MNLPVVPVYWEEAEDGCYLHFHLWLNLWSSKVKQQVQRTEITVSRGLTPVGAPLRIKSRRPIINDIFSYYMHG